jgi:hypothetical protein
MGSSSVTRVSGTPSIRDFFELFKDLVLRSPAWVRIVVVLIMSSLFTLYVLHLLGIYPPPATVPTGYSLAIGKQVPGAGDAQMAQATAELQADDAHSRWHDEHPEDNPPLKKVFQIADDNYLGYRFFDKSDHCVFIIRRESGKNTSRWLHDPQLQAQIAGEGGRATRARVPSDPSIVARLIDSLVPAAEAATLTSAEARAGEYMPAAQGTCVSGTHPGEFTWWWGAPEDQCWAPMYREWKDGCKHYQRFNKCSKAWDEAIHWVSCSAGPHG